MTFSYASERTVLIKMQSLFNLINIPFSYIMRFLASIFGGNFAASVFFFTLIINIVLLPLTLKSQKSTVQQTRIKPKLDDLKRRYGDDKQRYNTEMQKLYQNEGVSMSGGCLPTLLRLVIMMSIYWIVLSPLTYMAGADKTQVQNISAAITSGMTELEKSDNAKFKEISEEIHWDGKGRQSNSELPIVRVIRDHPDVIKEILSDEEYDKISGDIKSVTEKMNKANINFKLFGLDLTETPKFSFNFSEAQWIWLIPLGAFAAQILTSLVSSFIQKKNNPDTPSMVGMMLTMSLFSLFIGFSLPAGVGFYWICSSLIGGLLQAAIQSFYGPFQMLSRERAKELVTRCDFEAGQLAKLADKKDTTEE